MLLKASAAPFFRVGKGLHVGRPPICFVPNKGRRLNCGSRFAVLGMRENASAGPRMAQKA
jgi:hypothetical protein